MRHKSQTRQTGADKAIKDIRRATRKQYSAEEKIRIVLDGLRSEETISELCRREGIAQLLLASLAFNCYITHTSRVGFDALANLPTRQGGVPKGRCGQGRQLRGPQAKSECQPSSGNCRSVLSSLLLIISRHFQFTRST